MLGTAVVVLTFVSAAIGFALGHLAWKRRGVPGATSYAALVVVQGLWALSFGILLVSSAETTMYLFQTIVTVWSVSAVFLLLVFALAYTGRTAWLRPRRLAPLWTLPAAYLVLYATNPVHGIVYADVVVHRTWGLSYTVVAGNWPFYAMIGVVYLALLAVFLLLGAFLLESRNRYRKQTAAILVGLVVVVAGNLLWVGAVAEGGGIDLTPVFFVGNGVVIGWALFRYDFLDVAPLAADALVEGMADPIVVVDADRRLVDYNASAGEAFELGETAVGEPVDGPLADAVDAAETERTVEVGDETDASDDVRTVYQPNRTALYDHHDVARGELIVFRDVTAQKRHRENLEALQSGTRDLTDAETRADVAAITTAIATSILEHPFAGVLLYDDAREELVSASLSRPTRTELGVSEMRIDGGVVWDAFRAGEPRILDREALQEGQYSHLPLERVLVYPLGEHGVLGIGTATETAFTDDEIRFGEILALTAEASLDRAEREERLEARRAELADRSERLEEFASIVSHDLRNPLNTASGYLELARAEQTEEHFDAIEGAHDRMDRLIEDVLTLARQGDDVVDPSPVSITDVARAAWNTAGSDRATLIVEDDASIQADEQRLRTILENLFRNAHQHGGESVTVTVRAAPDSGCFAVEDDGPGVDADARDLIFEFGYSTESDGTGFGLGIVERIALAHGWSVSIADADDGGARFVFCGVTFAERSDAVSGPISSA